MSIHSSGVIWSPKLFKRSSIFNGGVETEEKLLAFIIDIRRAEVVLQVIEMQSPEFQRKSRKRRGISDRPVQVSRRETCQTPDFHHKRDGGFIGFCESGGSGGILSGVSGFGFFSGF